ncbi:MAG: DegT/DnrJ/EryC1/StrS family aminotransferase [Opitutales bacterium]|nr:DegT/DnrJ/EryC1/StrS family aminotransferase [Opitutales bacterium]
MSFNHGDESLSAVLSLYGGAPVRSNPLPSSLLGAALVGDLEEQAVLKVIQNKSLFRHYGIGTPHFADDFEKRLRDYFGIPLALGVSSCSGALQCAVNALGIGPGDEVILPAFAWLSCYNAIVLAGALPVFADIDRSLNLDPADLERKITPATKAVLVVHYQGGAARMDSILEIAERAGIGVIEDVAQAMGGRYKGKLLGTLGDVSAFSMQANKILCTGEGGFLLTRRPELFERAVRYHDLGKTRPTFRKQMGVQLFARDEADGFPGMQFRMSEVVAALGLAQFDRLDGMIADCRRKNHRLQERLRDALPEIRFRDSPDPEGDLGITLFLDLGNPERGQLFSKAYKAEGFRVGPSSGMVNLLHLDYVRNRSLSHPALAPFGPGHSGASGWYSLGDAPRTDKILDSMVGIAVGPLYSDEDMEDIARGIIKVYKGLEI